MNIIKPSACLLTTPDYKDVLALIESAGRTCYKSEGNICEGSAERLIRNIIKRGHESVLEHVSFSARFICDRGVSHEIVRHRLAAYSQESTRYCNYSDEKFQSEITVIQPCFFEPNSEKWDVWYSACINAEKQYFQLLSLGCKPQEARSVLPNSLKTEVVMTANIREWRHFFKLRCAESAHPQMREAASMLFNEMSEKYPIFFEDSKM